MLKERFTCVLVQRGSSVVQRRVALLVKCIDLDALGNQKTDHARCLLDTPIQLGGRGRVVQGGHLRGVQVRGSLPIPHESLDGLQVTVPGSIGDTPRSQLENEPTKVSPQDNNTNKDRCSKNEEIQPPLGSILNQPDDLQGELRQILQQQSRCNHHLVSAQATTAVQTLVRKILPQHNRNCEVIQGRSGPSKKAFVWLLGAPIPQEGDDHSALVPDGQCPCHHQENKCHEEQITPPMFFMHHHHAANIQVTRARRDAPQDQLRVVVHVQLPLLRLHRHMTDFEFRCLVLLGQRSCNVGLDCVEHPALGQQHHHETAQKNRMDPPRKGVGTIGEMYHRQPGQKKMNWDQNSEIDQQIVLKLFEDRRVKNVPVCPVQRKNTTTVFVMRVGLSIGTSGTASKRAWPLRFFAGTSGEQRSRILARLCAHSRRWRGSCNHRARLGLDWVSRSCSCKSHPRRNW
mmetsp:Transcript_26770/g.69289  ORF Transcript_26770/g.69289 Transcript_26770/m.69289 type:complete len:458 (+) Transcript_26770:1002-2375(+)